MGSLYDAHADRLYAHCWSLVGDQLAAAAVGDAFTAAVHQPPRGDAVLWLYSLSRSACAERGAFAGNLDGRGGVLFADADPLLRAAGALRADHREVLLLWAGEWLEPHDIARVLGIAPDTVAQLLDAARTRLERSVLDILMRGATAAPHELITAFEKKRLPRLLAGRAPARAPGWLRDRVLAACEEEAGRPLPTVASPAPLVVIGADRPERGRAAGHRGRARRGVSGGVHKGLGAAAGVAASAAAVIGLLAAWPSPRNGGDASIVPTATSGGANPASAANSGGPRHPMPGLSGTEKATSEAPGGPRGTSAGEGTGTGEGTATGGGTAPGTPAGGAPGGGTSTAPPVASPSGGPSRSEDPTLGTPSRPGAPSTSPAGGTPTAPPQTPSDPATPPGGGSGDPTAPPPDDPSDPPQDDTGTNDPGTDDPGTPSPSPTTNPEPSPSGG